MLTSFSKILTTFQQFCTHKHPFHLQILTMKLKEQDQINVKLNFLEELHTEKRLEESFKTETTAAADLQDICCYLVHRDIFRILDKKMHLEMVKKCSIDIYTIFIIVADTSIIKQEKCQIKLIKLFNQNCHNLPLLELNYCLKLMKKFRFHLLDELLNVEAMKTKLNQIGQQSMQLDYLQLLYHMKQIQKLENLALMVGHQRVIQLLNEKLLHRNTHIKYFYFMKKLQQFYGIIKPQAQENMREMEIQKIFQTAKTPQQFQYCIKILNYYTQFTFLIKIQKLTPDLYIEYLKFLMYERQNNPNFTVITHLIPVKICQQCTHKQFYKIVQLRAILGIQKIQQMGKKIKSIMTHNLECVYGLVKYLKQQQIQTPALWADLEDGFMAKMHWKDKKRDLHRLSSEYDSAALFNLLAYMSFNKLGSSVFWKNSHHFVYDFLLDPKLVKKIKLEKQNNFIICCYRIYGLKKIPDSVENHLKKLSLVAIANNKWPIFQLLQFTRCLTYNKIRDDEIWYAIEHKLMQVKVSKQSNYRMRRMISLIFEYFKQMKVGSYKYMKRMLLNEQLGVLIKPQQLFRKFVRNSSTSSQLPFEITEIIEQQQQKDEIP